MKIRINCVLTTTLLMLLAGIHIASAFYDPTAQRWINRDPIDEAGSGMLREAGTREEYLGTFPTKAVSDSFRFIENDPIHNFDVWGLTIWSNFRCQRNCLRTFRSDWLDCSDILLEQSLDIEDKCRARCGENSLCWMLCVAETSFLNECFGVLCMANALEDLILCTADCAARHLDPNNHPPGRRYPWPF